MQFKYKTNPLVITAYKITGVVNVEGFVTCFLEDGSTRSTSPGMCARYTPVKNDYWVVTGDGYTYINPKKVFEKKYSRVEHAT